MAVLKIVKYVCNVYDYYKIQLEEHVKNLNLMKNAGFHLGNV